LLQQQLQALLLQLLALRRQVVGLQQLVQELWLLLQ